ncbi:MAG: DMT family transporter [Verrucomicrobiota bacterium]
MNQSAPPTKAQSPIKALANNGMLLMFASVAFFATSNILVKLAGDTLSTPASIITTSRFAFGFLLAALLFRGKEKVSFKSLITNPWLISRGLIGGTGVYFYNECIINMDAGRTTVLISSYPIFAILLAPLFVNESIKKKQLGYCLLAFIGLIAMTSPSAFAHGVALWDGVAILVAIASGFVVVIIRKLHKTVNTSTIFISQCAYGLLFAAPQATRIDRLPELNAMMVVLGSSLLVILGQLAMTHGYKTVTVSKGSSISLLMPVLTTVASILIFGEKLAPFDLLGASLILFACFKISTDK